jgi:hypothetical protein
MIKQVFALLLIMPFIIFKYWAGVCPEVFVMDQKALALAALLDITAACRRPISTLPE